jgi:hypothetical protein
MSYPSGTMTRVLLNQGLLAGLAYFTLVAFLCWELDT